MIICRDKHKVFNINQSASSRCTGYSVMKLITAYSRVSSAFSTFWVNSEGIALRVAELNAALCFYTRARNGNINLNKYFISLSEDTTHNESRLQSHCVPLRHNWPQNTIYL